MRKFFAWVAWHLWGRRRWIREGKALEKQFNKQIERLRKNTFTQGKTTHSNSELMTPIRYDDMHLEHYERMAESLPKPVIPPPDKDDTGLN